MLFRSRGSNLDHDHISNQSNCISCICNNASSDLWAVALGLQLAGTSAFTMLQGSQEEHGQCSADGTESRLAAAGRLFHLAALADANVLPTASCRTINFVIAMNALSLSMWIMLAAADLEYTGFSRFESMIRNVKLCTYHRWFSRPVGCKSILYWWALPSCSGF